MGLGKPKLCTTFEVASFSYCVNIEGEPRNFGELPGPAPRLLFNPSGMQNVKSLASAVAEILKRNPNNLERSLAQGHTQFSPGCNFIMGLGKPKLCTKFEVASFGHSINIEREPPNLGSSLSQVPRPLFCVWFVMRLGRPQLFAKIEVVILSRCRNIKADTQNFGISPSSRPRPLCLPCNGSW